MIISGIQQIGVGVRHVNEAFSWYRKMLGFDIPVFDDLGTAELMLPYTGGKPQSRHAILAINMQGGGGLEIWQYQNRTPKASEFEIRLGDLGIFAAIVKTNDISNIYQYLESSGVEILTQIYKNESSYNSFFIKDAYDNILKIVECEEVFRKTKAYTGGVFGAVIGSSDIDKSINFYSNVLGYDKVLADNTGVFDDFKGLPGGDSAFRRVVLTHTKPRVGSFSRLFGSSQIELVQALDYKPKKIYENRYWGDLGYIHLCYDIMGMEDLKKICEDNKCPFTVDSNPEVYKLGEGTFDMGEASGHFSYTEDPDGTLIEFVETHKLPIIKKLGLSIDLRKRKNGKHLPDWMIKTLSWNRIKD